jgi:hypothetical protein
MMVRSPEEEGEEADKRRHSRADTPLLADHIRRLSTAFSHSGVAAAQ